jgi:hypothetical protein
VSYHVPEKLNHDLRIHAIVESDTLPWTPSPLPGVERRFLERDGGEVARATSIVRYAPGSTFSAHRHDKGEEYLVLDGVFSDESGDYAEGTYVRNPPGSRHSPFTREGCTIFVKLRQMPDSERQRQVIHTDAVELVPTKVGGLSHIPLHAGDDGEQVSIEVLEPGTEWRDRGRLGGEEIFVLEGTLLYGDERCDGGTWLRFPPGQESPLGSTTGCRLWVKRGHLAG